VIAASTRDEGVRLYVMDVDGAEPPRPITPEGMVLGSYPITPDGKFVIAQASDQSFYRYALEGGEPEPVPMLAPEDRPVRFGFDSRYLYGLRRGEAPAGIFRLDLTTGQKEAIHELVPPDPAGIVEVVSVVLTADAASYAYSYHRILSDLFLVEGAL
jgi:hypothetical protein